MYRHHFIRHAHRPEFDTTTWGHEVSITDEGKVAARRLGERLLEGQSYSFIASPIKRCIQTAEEMGGEVAVSNLLGGPGFMIQDQELAGNAFKELSLTEIIEQIVLGNHPEGFYSHEVGCQTMLKELLRKDRDNIVWVSHDITICILACFLFEKKDASAMLPEFLEGIEFSFEGAGVFAFYKGMRVRIDETSLKGRASK